MKHNDNTKQSGDSANSPLGSDGCNQTYLNQNAFSPGLASFVLVPAVQPSANEKHSDNSTPVAIAFYDGATHIVEDKEVALEEKPPSNLRHRSASESYVHDANSQKVLTSTQEAELAVAAKEGCTMARERLFLSCLPEVVKIALKFRRLGLPIEDLIAAGNDGVRKALKKFEPSKERSLRAYAAKWIHGEICKHLAWDLRAVKVDVKEVCLLIKFKKLEEQLQHKYHGEVTDEALADALGITAHRAAKLRHLNNCSVSFQHTAPDPKRDENDATENPVWLLRQGNLVADSHVIALVRQEYLDAVRSTLDVLDEFERFVVERHLGFVNDSTLTFAKIGELRKCSKQRVQQIFARAKAKLRPLLEKILRNA